MMKIKTGPTTIVIADGYESCRGFLLDVPRLFAEDAGRVLHDGRNQVRLLGYGGTQFVAKRYKRPNAVQRVVYTFFRLTKARRAYDYAAELRRRGIDTPHEVACIETKEHGLFATGYFVSLYCPDPPAFDRLVEQDEYDAEMAESIAQFILTMHRKGVLHGDMNLGNFLYRRAGGGGYTFTVVDTNRSRFLPHCPDDEACIRNLRTLTHRRDVFSFIVRRYAAARGWDEDRTLAAAMRCLDRFEQRHRRKDRLKHLAEHHR